MLIDCSRCEMYRTEHCDDCLVTALLHPPETNVEIEDDLDPQLRTLTEAGLIPVLKFRPLEEERGRPATPKADTG
ncbi:MAG: hypothetical protein M3214_15005 [Actinomycetota bacterium]|nr:hypothetical protein [Actinomycetota bacterium]